ncbi:deoxypodophyllotoxin synthase isoform X1 [Coffea arabica]|uniref:Deoxypodophyllotoxin synthase isoform X1 n=1 Tax=Coffea arabica TaxID=13443 RepID=A0A6P6WIQ2_COFAR|nr:2-oxoglutarate-dependent dioxygenase AOP2-like [Coffea arabica]
METNNPQVCNSQTQKSKTIPVIYFTTENLNLGTSSWLSTCKAVREALEEFSCFIAVYDKAESECKIDVFASLKEFFNLPMETKLLNVHPDKSAFGYFGPKPNFPLLEAISIEDSTTIEAVQSFANLAWPSGNDHFCETICACTRQLSEVNRMVSKMIFESYGVGRYIDSHIESTSYLFRANAYRVPQEKEPNLGISPHTDTSFVSVLKQDSVQGLQVQSKDGTWIPVDFPPSSFAIMAGDAMLAWSNGRVRPCFHRVMVTEKARTSIGLFSFHTGIVQVPKELVDDNYPSQFTSFDHWGLLKFRSKNPALSSSERVKAYCGRKDI